MAIKFYDVKGRQSVSVNEDKIKKTKYERKTKSGNVQVRYALRASYEGRNLTKFVSKEDWDKLNVAEE